MIGSYTNVAKVALRLFLPLFGHIYPNPASQQCFSLKLHPVTALN